MKTFWTFSIGKKLNLTFALIATLFLFFGLFAYNTIQEVKVTGSLYQQIIDKKDLVADILPPPAFIIEAYLCTMDIATHEELAGEIESLPDNVYHDQSLREMVE